MKIVLLFLMYGFSIFSFSATPEVAVSMVPRGKIYEQIGRDFIIKTTAGTKIEIAFNLSGNLQRAKGRNLNKGDELEPGEGLLSLSSAAQIAMSTGKRPEGPWSLENDKTWGWIYEIDQMLISAKEGKLIKTKKLSAAK